MKINPIELVGAWDKGFALDYHSVKSTPIGEDPFGHMQFDTTYTPIGELLNKFKYHNQYDNVDEIVDAAVSFLEQQEEMSGFQAILPVPPSKKNRTYQPAFEIAGGLAKRLGIPCTTEVLEKQTTEEYKNLSLSEKEIAQGIIIQKKKANYEIDVLLVDDVYKSGSTLRQCTEVLRTDPNIDKIFVLTITKTRT